MSVVWKASAVCILSPKCPVSLLQVDSWALGVLLYTLIYGTMPFDGFDHKNLIRQISSGEYREPTQPSGACPMRLGVDGRRLGLSAPAHIRFTRHHLLLLTSLFSSWKTGEMISRTDKSLSCFYMLHKMWPASSPL